MTTQYKEGDTRFSLSLKNKQSTSYTTLIEAIKAFLATKSRTAFISEETYRETGGYGSFVFYVGLTRYGKSSRSFRFDRKSAKRELEALGIAA